MNNQIFISYAREDYDFALKIYNDLKGAGYKPWLDKKDLLPGQRWKIAIKEAITNSSFFIALLSNNSITKRGHIQEEFKIGFEILDSIPESHSHVFFIPVRIEDCSPNIDRLQQIHWADLFPTYEEGFSKILLVLKKASDNIKETEKNTEDFSDSTDSSNITDSSDIDDTEKIKLTNENFDQVRTLIHDIFINTVNFRKISLENPTDLHEQCRNELESLIESTVITNSNFMEYLIKRLLQDILGNGIIDDLLEDEAISEVLVNKWDTIFVRKNGNLQFVKEKFLSEKNLMNIIGKIISKIGRRIDYSTPIINTRLHNGDRIFVIAPPVAVNGASITIKKSNKNPTDIKRLIQLGTLNTSIAEFLSLSVKARLNIIISGNPSTGKTSLLNSMSNMIHLDDRIITIEDVAELSLYTTNSVSLESRPPNIEGKGEITVKDLIRAAQNMIPDRIIVGDCRYTEVYELLRSSQQGFKILTTIVAGSPDESISKIQGLIKTAINDIPNDVINEMIINGIDLIIQLESINDKKIISSISEPVLIKGNTVSIEKIFVNDSNIYRDMIYTGYNSKCLDKIRKEGININESIFMVNKG